MNDSAKAALGLAALVGVWVFARSASARSQTDTGLARSDDPIAASTADGDALDAYLFSGTAAQQAAKKRWMWVTTRLYTAGWSQIVPSVPRLSRAVRENADPDLDPSLSLALGHPARAGSLDDVRELGKRSPVSQRKTLPILLTTRTVEAILALDAEYRR